MDAELRRPVQAVVRLRQKIRSIMRRPQAGRWRQPRERRAVARAPLATNRAMPAQPIRGTLSPNITRLSRAAETMPGYCRVATTKALRLVAHHAVAGALPNR